MIEDFNTIKQVIRPGANMSYVIFNGIDITNECRFEDGKVHYPDWLAKELNDSFKREQARKNKPLNRLLRLLGLYKEQAGAVVISAREMT